MGDTVHKFDRIYQFHSILRDRHTPISRAHLSNVEQARVFNEAMMAFLARVAR